ncbi:hypothetical protein [Acanthamoeba polyphaga mimivirus]|uniref:Uncharacterized protein n=6 Tax=Megamimivirinae TaxID=3044648 RepID=A0A2L2DJ98_MIMIV|nr:hypothetical protein MegaChil _gp0508 [Megavirus chiliensis]AEX61656.1 hypothetical protein c7_L593 [Megavirus courdo7]AFX92563.1 hypothetical protein CE11_00537 [Megavirus courdo11]AGD92430.1 hypothetical protein LBA_00512 [Megavirus lba]AUV58455.1 hypothetical protein [Bandra megavirus]AVG46239.1 hypothetical protein [Acanthamoeba polyphaga mimivirus]AVL93833.1 hypothetical protein mvi_473 [Megavirus vitis]
MKNNKTGFYVIIVIILIILAYWFFRNYMSNRQTNVVNDQTFQALQANIRSLNQQLLFIRQQLSTLHVPIPTDIRNRMTTAIANINQQVAALNRQVQVFLPQLNAAQQSELGQTLAAFNTNAMDVNNTANNLLNENISLFRYSPTSNLTPSNTVNFDDIRQSLSTLQTDTNSLTQTLSRINPQEVPTVIRNELEKLVPSLNQKITDLGQKISSGINQLPANQRNILQNILNGVNNNIGSLNKVLSQITHHQINTIKF